MEEPVSPWNSRVLKKPLSVMETTICWLEVKVVCPGLSHRSVTESVGEPDAEMRIRTSTLGNVVGLNAMTFLEIDGAVELLVPSSVPLRLPDTTLGPEIARLEKFVPVQLSRFPLVLNSP